MDDYVFASYSSSKIKTKTHEFNESKQKSSARFQSRLLTQCAAGDAMVRELDQSRITLRLLEHIDREGKGSEKNVIAKLSGPTLQTLQKCLYTATPLVLRDDEGHESRVTVKLKFIPVKMKLNPSESFRNMGNLKVEVLDGANLPAARSSSTARKSTRRKRRTRPFRRFGTRPLILPFVQGLQPSLRFRCLTGIWAVQMTFWARVQ